MLAALAWLRDGERSELIQEDVGKGQSVNEVTVIKATSKMKNKKM